MSRQPYTFPKPTEIWGRDMTRATFRRFVEADAREARTNHNFKLALAIKNDPNRQQTDNPATATNSSELSALEEFRVMRSFPTLLKIISKQGTGNQTVDTGRFSRELRTSKRTVSTQNQSTSNNNNNNNDNTTAPLLSMQNIDDNKNHNNSNNTSQSLQRIPLCMNDLVKIRNQRSYLRGDVELFGSGIGKVTLNSTTGLDIGCAWRLQPIQGEIRKSKEHNFFERTNTDKHLKYGMEFRIVLDYMSTTVDTATTNDNDASTVPKKAEAEETEDDEESNTITYVLCASMTEHTDPSMFHTDQRYVTTLRVMEANNAKAKGKASIFCFTGGAKGKPVLSSRGLRIKSMNCKSDHEGLLRNENNKVKLRIRVDSDDVLVPKPHDASYNWFIDLDENDVTTRKDENTKQMNKIQKLQTLTIGNTNTNGTVERPIVTPSPRSKSSPRNLRVSAAAQHSKQHSKQPQLASPASTTSTTRSKRMNLNSNNKNSKNSKNSRDRSDSETSFVDGMLNRPAFSPCSPSKAKKQLSRAGMSASVGVPYTALKDAKRIDAQNQIKGRLDGSFKAAGKIGSRYINRNGNFLHSPDDRCKSMEKNFLKERAEKGLKLLSEKHESNRAFWLKKQKERDRLEMVKNF